MPIICRLCGAALPEDAKHLLVGCSRMSRKLLEDFVRTSADAQRAHDNGKLHEFVLGGATSFDAAVRSVRLVAKLHQIVKQPRCIL